MSFRIFANFKLIILPQDYMTVHLPFDLFDRFLDMNRRAHQDFISTTLTNHPFVDYYHQGMTLAMYEH